MAERPRVLMTLADVAWPVDAGKRLRCASMVRVLASSCDLDVVVLFADADPSVCPLPPEVTGSWQLIPPAPRSVPRAALDLLRYRLPWQIAVQDWAAVRARLAEHRANYDLVWFGALDHFSRLRNDVRARKVIVDCDDVETEKLRRYLALSGNRALPWADLLQRRIELPLWAGIQRQAVRAADAVLVCSELDRQRLVEQAAGNRPDGAAARIVSVPNTYAEPDDIAPRRPDGDCRLVVIANYGTDQNLDAADFVAHQLLPPLRRAVPGARVRLVGRRPDRLAGLRRMPGLDIVGPVDSVAEELSRAHAVLVPIRFGGGTRLKIVEAFAYGAPVISTSAGAEGIDAADGSELLVADTADQLVAAVRRVLDEPGLAERLGAAGQARYRQSYRPQAGADTVNALVARLLG